MEITFYGVRGSIASPGPETAQVGGNTSCVEVVCGAERIILDAGTGLRKLGDRMMAQGQLSATMLLSHQHWDHIQGIPFFVPAYVPAAKLRVYGGMNGVMSLRETLECQMTAPVFPVRLDELGAEIDLREVRSGQTFMVGDAQVRALKVNHPGGCFAYRIDYRGQSMVYATDTEHYACVDPALRALAQGADVLIYDAQYTDAEYPQKVGWGHSTPTAAVALAEASGARQLVLFHHDPRRDDAAVLALEAETRRLFSATCAAMEGRTVRVDGRSIAVSEVAHRHVAA